MNMASCLGVACAMGLSSVTLAQDLVITGVADGPLPGGLPKAIELHAINDIPDLSQYGIELVSNGGGSGGVEEYTFPADALTAGSFIYVATETAEFTNFFGFAPDYTTFIASFNGDDALIVYFQGAAYESFGDPNVDGTGQTWEYLDGWAYRVDGTGPDGAFAEANWTFSGPNALDGETTNDTAATPFPIGSYVFVAGDCNNNGTPDADEIAADPSIDCDSNGVIDTCELAGNDCNLNGVLDVCDIAEGTSDDDNMNGVPDECDPTDVAEGELVITEFLKNPSAVADGDGEWFEIYNASGRTLNIAGLTFRDNDFDTFSIPAFPAVELAPGEFFVLGANADTLVNGGVPVDYEYGGAMALGNSSQDEIIIENNGTVIDEVIYDTLSWPDVAGASLSLDPSKFTAVDNDNPLFWCVAVDPYGDGDLGTPGVTNPACDIPDDTDGDGVPDAEDNCPNTPNADQRDCDLDGVGDACEDDLNGNNIPDDCENGWIINEIHYDPDFEFGDANNDMVVDSFEDEFVEIVNVTGGAVNIGGWTISDGNEVRHTFASGTTIEDNCAVVVFGGGVPTGPFGGVTVAVASTGDMRLNNDGDVVTLSDNLGNVVISYRYDASIQDESINRTPDVTGLEPLVAHSGIPGSGGALYSPGTRVDGTSFGGCSAPVDSDGDNIFDQFDNCPDIANPGQEDCDGDGIGDVCELADCAGDPDCGDCNANGIPDGCDIDNLIANDCNGNGIPDLCDLDSGVLTDANGDGFPDECVVVPPAVVINEFRIAQPGADLDQYFELRGASNANLDGLVYVVIDGDGSDGDAGIVESVTKLDGNFLRGTGLFVAAEDSFDASSLFSPADVDLLLSYADDDLRFFSGQPKTHLLVANWFGALGQDLDTDDDGVLDVTPWLDELDSVGLIDGGVPGTDTGYTYSAVTVGPDGLFLPAHAYRCVPDDTWTAGLFDPFDMAATDTVQDDNAPCPGDPCPEDLTGDSTVNADDLFALLGAWGACPGCPEDLTGDGAVNADDLFQLLGAWGDCP